MTSNPERPITTELEHDEDRRAALGKVIAAATGAFVVLSSGIAGAQARKPSAQALKPAGGMRLDAKTTDLIPRQYHSKLSPRARGLTAKDLQAIAAGTLTAAQKDRLKDVTFGDLKSIIDAVTASPRVSAGTIVRGGGEVSSDHPGSCCCSCCCE
jgi:hypothetical protein